jgi:hypothetical protein
MKRIIRNWIISELKTAIQIILILVSGLLIMYNPKFTVQWVVGLVGILVMYLVLLHKNYITIKYQYEKLKIGGKNRI